MFALPSDPTDPFARSRVRTQVVLALLTHGPRHADELARLAGVETAGALDALAGDPHASLAALGLVIAVATERGPMFALTERGREEALSLACREPRRFATWV